MRVLLLPRLMIAMLAVGALVLPAEAYAQGGTTSPFSPALPAAPSATPTTTTTTPTAITPSTTSTSGGGLSGASTIAIAVGALVVLGGISLFIWYDARRRAPVRHRAALASGNGSRSGSKQRAKPRKLSPAERRRRKRGRAR